MPPKLYPRLLLAVLTGLNILNYIDRNVLFAVQSDVKKEFMVSDAKIGLLTSAFFFTYMFAAPLIGWMGDRFPRKNIVVFGICIWSGFTFLTWFVHDYNQLLFRHAIVGIGEASYATIAPTLIADSFPPLRRGRMLSIFFLGLPVGSAAGYFVGGYLAHYFCGSRAPFMAAGIALLVAVPLMVAAIYATGSFMFPAIFAAVFFILIGTGPTNAALVNSVSASIRSTALAVNVFIIHLLGDAFSPTLIGRLSDKTGSLQTPFSVAFAAAGISGIILLYGSRFAPRFTTNAVKAAQG